MTEAENGQRVYCEIRQEPEDGEDVVLRLYGVRNGFPANIQFYDTDESGEIEAKEYRCLSKEDIIALMDGLAARLYEILDEEAGR